MGLSLAAMMLIIIYIGGTAMYIVTSIGGAFAMWEYYQLLGRKGIRPMATVGIVFGLLFLALPFFGKWATFFGKGAGSIGIVLTVYVFLILIIQFWQIMRHSQRHSIMDLSITVFGSLYIGAFLSFIIMLMNIADAQFPTDRWCNRLVIMLPMIAAWISDAGAYFFGSFFGKNRIFPELSPKKTLEGCFGGIISSVASFVFVAAFIKIPIIDAAILGGVASMFGQIGDLSESAFKRELNIKDSSAALGSHGGFLDRIDSILFTLPVVYYYFEWFNPWG